MFESAEDAFDLSLKASWIRSRTCSQKEVISTSTRLLYLELLFLSARMLCCRSRLYTAQRSAIYGHSMTHSHLIKSRTCCDMLLFIVKSIMHSYVSDLPNTLCKLQTVFSRVSKVSIIPGSVPAYLWNGFPSSRPCTVYMYTRMLKVLVP